MIPFGGTRGLTICNWLWAHLATRCFVTFTESPSEVCLVAKGMMESKIYLNKRTIPDFPTTTKRLVGAPMNRPSEALATTMAKELVENRRTTAEEDAAYYLLSPFNIQIPPIYGEGEREHCNL